MVDSANGVKKYGRGYQPDPINFPAKSFERLKFSRAVGKTPYGSALLTKYAPEVMDQGDTSSCTGHASSGAIFATAGAQGVPLSFVPSPLGIYTVARAVDRIPTKTTLSAPVPLSDDGAMPNQVWRGITQWGVHPIAAPTSDGRYSDAESKTINDEPSFSSLLADRKSMIVREHRIDSVGPSRIIDFCLALDAGMAIAIGVFVDSAFENWKSGDDPLGLPNLSDPNGGGHYIYVLGYRTTAAGRRVFRFRNSWGASWGMDGDAEASEIFVNASTDAYVSNVNGS